MLALGALGIASQTDASRLPPTLRVGPSRYQPRVVRALETISHPRQCRKLIIERAPRPDFILKTGLW